MPRPCRSARAAIVLFAAAAPAAQAPLADLVRQAESRGLRTGVAVVDVDSGQPIFRHRAGDAFVPASAQKLVTAAACLEALGADYEFRTVFRLRRGELEVHAGGDPSWRTGSIHDPAAIFARVAERLLALGVSALRGVRLVDGAFVGPARPDGWPADQLHLDYCAPTGGLVLDGGCYRIEIRGDAGAARAELALLAPPAPIEITGALPLTDDRRRGSRFGFVLDGARLRAHGAFLRGAPPRVVAGSLADPGAVFGAALVTSLARAGIVVHDGAPERDADVLVYDTPLTLPLSPMLKDSSNFDAEQCFRVLGAERADDGSFAGARRATRAAIEALIGSVPEPVVFADGSGLSRANRLTPELLTGLLVAATRRPWAASFLDALAQGGVDGTLKSRFGGALRGRVRAKTGTLNGASTLAGYVRRGDDRLAAFAILIEYTERVRGAGPRDVQDALVAAIAQLDV